MVVQSRAGLEVNTQPDWNLCNTKRMAEITICGREAVSSLSPKNVSTIFVNLMYLRVNKGWPGLEHEAGETEYAGSEAQERPLLEADCWPQTTQPPRPHSTTKARNRGLDGRWQRAKVASASAVTTVVVAKGYIAVHKDARIALGE